MLNMPHLRYLYVYIYIEIQLLFLLLPGSQIQPIQRSQSLNPTGKLESNALLSVGIFPKSVCQLDKASDLSVIIDKRTGI